MWVWQYSDEQICSTHCFFFMTQFTTFFFKEIKKRQAMNLFVWLLFIPPLNPFFTEKMKQVKVLQHINLSWKCLRQVPPSSYHSFVTEICQLVGEDLGLITQSQQLLSLRASAAVGHLSPLLHHHTGGSLSWYGRGEQNERKSGKDLYDNQVT